MFACGIDAQMNALLGLTDRALSTSNKASALVEKGKRGRGQVGEQLKQSFSGYASPASSPKADDKSHVHMLMHHRALVHQVTSWGYSLAMLLC